MMLRLQWQLHILQMQVLLIRTVVHSIHICNILATEATISGEIQSSFSFAHTIPVPAGSAVELLKQPKVLGPSETIELQSDTSSALEATIIVEEKEDTALWDAADCILHLLLRALIFILHHLILLWFKVFFFVMMMEAMT